MKQLLVVFILLFTLKCTTPSYNFTYDGYRFSFPMKIRHAESVFGLNRRIAGKRIARLDSNGCKEIQITYEQAFQDSSYVNFDSTYADQVDAISFYHHEDVLVLKEKLESAYGKEFEPITILGTNHIYYYKMHLAGPVNLLLYANSYDICAKQLPQKIVGESKSQEDVERNKKISVVAFTYHLKSRRHFDMYINLDGYYEYSD